MTSNAACLERELAWFDKVVQARITRYFEHDDASGQIGPLDPPDLSGDDSFYAVAVRDLGLDAEERFVLILALIPHIRPQLLDTFFIRNKNFDRGFTEFGGWKGKTHGGFLPTCETAAFILAGTDLAKRVGLMRMFEDDHVFARKGVLKAVGGDDGEPFFSSVLSLSPDYRSRLVSGVQHRPNYTVHFPARLITTRLTWDDLVLAPELIEEVENINTWLRHSRTIRDEWGLGRSIKPGYRSLFYGPPGTGKTLTATLIGAAVGADVYRIDLSMMVSKYIGETEKNLASVFDQAENKDWILFFDEADALFGKRTQTTNSHDRYANQEVSYLLQRIEDFPRLVILATNLKANIDEAFARRFQSVVYFPMPDAEQRLRLWRGILCGNVPLDPAVDLESLAEAHEISGGAITNVVGYAAIRAVQKVVPLIAPDDLIAGIQRERLKEGKTSG